MITIPRVTRDRRFDGPATVMASRFELSGRAGVPAFLVASMVAYVQALRAPGVVTVSLRAEPWHARFWTLSSWRDAAALRAYAEAEPHRSVMTRMRRRTRTSRFVTWRSEVRPTWTEAVERVHQADAEAAAAPLEPS